jgi:hypothetical protein
MAVGSNNIEIEVRSSSKSAKRSIDKLTASLKNLRGVFANFRTPLGKTTTGLGTVNEKAKKLNTTFKKTKNTVKGAGGAFDKAGGSLKAMATKVAIVTYAIMRMTRVVGGWIKQSNAYVENLNLFTATMGEYAGEALRYAEQVGEVMGIDPSDWIRSQGIFNTLITGFGVSADKAAEMSKNLTQLTYDISSFYNIATSNASLKLESGIAGELEPLRRLGWDLSQAALTAVALENGITKAYTSMTQGEKSMLRYVAIMEQVTVVQGDMARTLHAPANQLRILGAQARMASRSLGNIFIPALNAILPYAIAFLKIIRKVSDAIANLFGFSLPEIDYSGISSPATDIAGGLDDIEDGASGAAKAMKELKNATLGFDELNVISPPVEPSGGGGGSLDDIGDGGFGNLDVTGYDFLGDAASGRVDEITGKMIEDLGKLKEKIVEFFEPISDAISPNLDSMSESIDKIKESFANISESDAFKTIKDFFIETLKKFAGSNIITFFSQVDGFVESIADYVEIIEGVMTGDWEMAVNAVPDAIVDMSNLRVEPQLVKIDYLFGTDFAEKWNTNIVEPIKSFDFAGWIKKSAGKVSNFFNTTIPSWMTGLKDLKDDIKDTDIFYEIGYSLGRAVGVVGEKLSEFDEKLTTWTDELPGKIKEGLDKFLTETLPQWGSDIESWITTALPKIINKIAEWFFKLPNTIHNIGYNVVVGLWNGIISAGDWLVNKVKGFFGDLWDSVSGAFESFGSGFSAGYKSIPTYATGGMPEDGLFMANSTELVGQFSNGKTAVANNDQIIAGISQGVANANAETNQLLIEQNEYLRELLEKDTSVNIGDKDIYNANSRYSKGRGVPILEGV